MQAMPVATSAASSFAPTCSTTVVDAVAAGHARRAGRPGPLAVVAGAPKPTSAASAPEQARLTDIGGQPGAVHVGARRAVAPVAALAAGARRVVARALAGGGAVAQRDDGGRARRRAAAAASAASSPPSDDGTARTRASTARGAVTGPT